MTEARRVPNHNEADLCPTRGSSQERRPIDLATSALGAPQAGARRLHDGDIHGGGRKLDHRHRDADDRRRSGRVQPVSWVFAVYLLTQAVSIPVYGRLADMYGRKKVFYFGAGLFLIGSTLCGLRATW